ncbi:GroES-like protein, partial [Polychaeton citri CBS 116435]
MPSTLSSSPFLSLRPDHECGRKKEQSLPFNTRQPSSKEALTNGHDATTSNSSFKNLVNGDAKANGYTNGHTKSLSKHHDSFLKLSEPQQDLLLLHGPRQKYSLEASDIPELRDDDEILIQVLAIGLNPVDWKGADYGFGQPSYPWVNGRDFAGIVIRAPRRPSRVKQGDVVFGPSTDYRDIRKAAYQEYVVTTDYNVARIPQGIEVKEGAALGVAFVAAALALGISFGLNFNHLQGAPTGPDYLSVVRSLDPRAVPLDIRDELFSKISASERPQLGEWLAIWGANTTTGQLALQLAKHAGLKVAAVADIAKGGQRLTELGADFLVDKFDKQRAVDILKAVTGGKLRFAIDMAGKETAELLQSALQQSPYGPKSHLLGFAGLPKQPAGTTVLHSVPIKIFHESSQVGEATVQWLEELLISKSLQLPLVDVVEGGLAGINDALDKMRAGLVSGKRIVVAV